MRNGSVISLNLPGKVISVKISLICEIKSFLKGIANTANTRKAEL